VFNPHNYPIALQKPHWLTSMAFWHKHIPFAFALTEMLKPKTYVELGTHMGDSFCAFCQAVDTLQLDTTCYAVDTWAGDEHTGHYDDSIYEDLLAYTNAHYGGFTTLIRRFFDDALDLFDDHSIDLLHIDGTHTYDAVKQDFEVWLPKMSQHGVIIMHDVNEYRDNFGVWRLWDELRVRYPSFEFLYGYGLGVIAVGTEIPAAMDEFLNDKRHASATARYFQMLGDRVDSEPDSLTDSILSPMTDEQWSEYVASESDSSDRSQQGKARVIAFYLPQFHPVPENDVWWGKGFTEWRYVVEAAPRFPGHYQPHLPAELGFYDLRLPEVRQAQVDLAKEYGIHGFCYYHYWFKGRLMLERPFDEVLASGQPDFPFCLCWANESWTRNWDGMEQECLIAQDYSEQDDREHIQWLIHAFRDKRYITIDGRPLLLIYRTQSLPDPVATISLWKQECQAAGVPEPYICRFETLGSPINPNEVSCDAAAEFLPNGIFSYVNQVHGDEPYLKENHVVEYQSLVAKHIQRPIPSYTRFPCILPQWDNTPRHKSDAALIIRGSTPELYEQWLRGTIAQSSSRAPEENIVFVNAWNEWAEGAHLEPDLKFGHAYLEATKRALRFTPEEAPEHPEHVNTDEDGLMPPVLSLQDRYTRLSERYAKLQYRFTEQLSMHERTALVQALKDNLSRHDALIADLQKSLDWSESQRVANQASAIWHQDQLSELQKGLAWSETKRREIQEGLAWHVNQLSEVEKSLAWSESQRQALQESNERLEGQVNELRKALRESNEWFEHQLNEHRKGSEWLEGQLSEVRKSLEWSETQRHVLEDSVVWPSRKYK